MALGLCILGGALQGSAAPDIAGLRLWLRASDLDHLADGSRVTVWPNAAPDLDAIAARQASAANQPVLRRVAFGGGTHAVVRFEGSENAAEDDFLSLRHGDRPATWDDLLRHAQITVLAVVKADGANARAPFFGNHLLDFVAAGSQVRSYRHADLVRRELSSEGFFAVCFTHAELAAGRPDIAAAYVNGEPVASRVLATSALALGDPLFVGHVGGAWFGGHLAELLVYDRVLDGAELQACHAYLRARFGLEQEPAPVLGPSPPPGTRKEEPVAHYMRVGPLARERMVPIPTNTDYPDGVDLWPHGRGPYRNYRIPALLVTPTGAVLAFCEGRSGDDTSDIDLLVKRSEDGGVTWSDATVVWGDAGNTSGNPCPVVDRETGTIWMAMTWNHIEDDQAKVMDGTAKHSRQPCVTHSTDDGRTWAPARNVAATCKHPDWRWYATGPGIGIQLERGPYKGRLVIPCNHSAPYPYYEDGYAGHIMYSDDHGTSWKYSSGVIGLSETQVVERVDGRLLMHGRNQGPAGHHMKIFAHGHDGGTVWSPPRFEPQLTEPKCQSSLMRYSWPEDRGRGGRSRVVFAHPAGTVLGGAGKFWREILTVRLSYDEGATWSVAKVLDPRPAGYSCLAVLPDGDLACLYEAGPERYADRPGCALVFKRFSLSWLTDGRDSGRQ